MNMLNRKTLLIVLMTVTMPLAVFLTAACQNLPAGTSLAGKSLQATPLPTEQPPVREPTSALGESIQAQGTFTAPEQATLTFKGSGRITEVRIQEGAEVKKGDTLAVLDTTELELAVQQAQAVLAGARAHLSQAKSPATGADTASAQAAVDAALKNYEKVRAGPTANDLAALKAQLENAKASVDQAQAAYDKIGGASNPYIGMSPQALQLQTATNNYNAALAAYNGALTHPNAAELAAAWQQVLQAQDALSRLQPTSDSIAVAQAQVDQAQAALALAQQQVADATLVAPFGGTVISPVPHVGENVGPTTLILTIADLTHLELQAGVDQVMLAQLVVGEPVTIVTDAFKDKTISGHVARIGWVATSTAGVTNVPVTIQVDPSPLPLRPGLTASATFNVGN